MTKTQRAVEQAAKEWCLEKGCHFVGYFKKGKGKRGNHGKIIVKIFGEQMTVTAACTPRGGVDTATKMIKKNLNHALLLKLDEIAKRRKAEKEQWKKRSKK